ncbi:hypothetical protein T492DRAFT_844963 [Pavlovales sp. CCMP2436]|nr:hypothetical protein T492DRAFT_844963 [Pavlovales sp. CCMP2436]
MCLPIKCLILPLSVLLCEKCWGGSGWWGVGGGSRSRWMWGGGWVGLKEWVGWGDGWVARRGGGRRGTDSAAMSAENSGGGLGGTLGLAGDELRAWQVRCIRARAGCVRAPHLGQRPDLSWLRLGHSAHNDPQGGDAAGSAAGASAMQRSTRLGSNSAVEREPCRAPGPKQLGVEARALPVRAARRRLRQQGDGAGFWEPTDIFDTPQSNTVALRRLAKVLYEILLDDGADGAAAVRAAEVVDPSGAPTEQPSIVQPGRAITRAQSRGAGTDVGTEQGPGAGTRARARGRRRVQKKRYPHNLNLASFSKIK